MNLTDVVRRFEHLQDADEAFRTLMLSLREGYPVRAGRWRHDGSEGYWPAEAEAQRLLAEAPRSGHLLAVPMGEGAGELKILLDPQARPIEWAELERIARAFAAVVERDRAGGDVDAEREELRRRVEESEALHALGLAANRTLEPGEVLNLVARTVRTLLGAHYVTVSTQSEGTLRTVAAAGLRGRAWASDLFAERVVQAGRPLVTGTEGAPRLAELDFHREEGMETGLGVPLALFGEIFGALVVGYRRQYELRPRDSRLALTLAGHAAVAISNARLHRALATRSEELEKANQELRWTAAAKERFFASVSHELRTPIHSILGYNSLLLEGMAGELPPHARSFLANAQRATQALLVVINDLLDFTRMEAGKMELAERAVDPARVVREAIDTVRPLVGAKDLAIEERIAPEIEPIVTDPDRMRQILINLLSNAIKFSDAGLITISLVEEPASAAWDGRWILVRVQDTGPGIPQHDRERIFHEFEQVAGPATSAGSGLGLPISRKLARLLGGDLALEAGNATGSSFLLRLPASGSERGASIA